MEEEMRNRNIDTAFWTDEKTSPLPPYVRLMYICLWNLADDKGRIKGNPHLIKSVAFLYDEDTTVAMVRSGLHMLEDLKRIVQYSDNGENYILVVNLLRHQFIQAPSASKLSPPPRELLEELNLPQEYMMELLDDEPWGSGRKAVYGKKTKSLQDATRNAKTSTIKKDAEDIFLFWVRVMGKAGRIVLSKKREGKIKARLSEGYTKKDIKTAIMGCRKSPFHRGENDRKTVYDDIELICRDPEHVEKFIEMAKAEGVEIQDDADNADE